MRSVRPGSNQDTTTITLYGAYDEAARPGAGPVPPCPASGHSKDRHDGSASEVALQASHQLYLPKIHMSQVDSSTD